MKSKIMFCCLSVFFISVTLKAQDTLKIVQGPLALTAGASTDSGGYSTIKVATTGSSSTSGYSELQSFYAGSGSYTSPLILQKSGGSVGIGVTDTKGYMLAVNGSAIFTQAVVKLNTNWPDYVFENDYSLPTLSSVQSYIETNKHLPGIPSASNVQNNGVDLGNTQALLLKKIEELTLYVIDQNKQIQSLQESNKLQSEKIEALEKGLGSKR